MNELENVARPLLTPMLKGLDTELPPDAQAVASRWIFKTALMAQYMRSPVVPVPPERLAWLRTEGVPPAQAWIGVGRYTADVFASWWFHKSVRWEGDGPNPKTALGHMVTLSLGHLVTQTAVWDGELDMSVKLSEWRSRFLIQIWPSTTSIVLRWPPTYDLLNDDLVAVAESFTQTVD
jgi:hypothetical protein